MGHKVETINYKRALLFKKYDISYIKEILPASRSKAKQHMRRFINEHIHLTSPFHNKKNFLKHAFSRFDAVIVGSDQVWRTRYAFPDIYTYFLDFLQQSPSAGKRILKIAFSASFGTDEAEYTKEQIQKCGEYIRDFDLVTVRENSGLALINKVYQWKCKHTPLQTLDPAMLLRKEDYVRLSSDCHNETGQGGLFYYVLDMTEEKRNLIRKIASELGIQPFTVNRKSNRWYDKLEDRMMPPPEAWLHAFDKAAYVFTDSFHGAVFSILFNKAFVVIGNRQRGMSRFHSLLDLFNLHDRLVYAEDEYDARLYRTSIDWNAVNLILDKEREKSLACLKQIGTQGY